MSKNLTFSDLQSLVATPESAVLELKETTGQLTRAMESGCAFLNGGMGGNVVFGVTAVGKIIGQDVSDTTRRNIAQLLKKIEPGVLIDTEYIPVPNSDKFVIVLHFEDSFMRKPFTFDGRAYMRLESTTTVMPS